MKEFEQYDISQIHQLRIFNPFKKFLFFGYAYRDDTDKYEGYTYRERIPTDNKVSRIIFAVLVQILILYVLCMIWNVFDPAPPHEEVILTNKQIWAIVSVVMGYFTIPSLIYLILTHIEEKRYEVMLMVEDFNHDSYKKYTESLYRTPKHNKIRNRLDEIYK